MNEYEDLFSPGIGKLKDTVESIHLKPDAVPQYFKARKVPPALQPACERELDRLQSLQINSKVSCSEWSTPTVPIVKSQIMVLFTHFTKISHALPHVFNQLH
ncbi:hypothetical protein LSTR_LSTR017316 [Laodelphax striatellus]|uniref:Uncharacterized protein n=1 Tax=Laodelphax striatellus TaxID=195883 RepID=A0A482WSI4_LAOST|nr:hypothetical protein LSTR_LSTR017316 [Laodelphax striatellus]